MLEEREKIEVERLDRQIRERIGQLSEPLRLNVLQMIKGTLDELDGIEMSNVHEKMSASIVKEDVNEADDGAAWLDEHHPGWAERINLDTFDLRSGSMCVLGQLFGDFDEAVSKYNLDGRDYDYGFMGLEKEEAGAEHRDWDTLEDRWRTLIADRQSR
jgi:hypothetical protein